MVLQRFLGRFLPPFNMCFELFCPGNQQDEVVTTEELHDLATRYDLPVFHTNTLVEFRIICFILNFGIISEYHPCENIKRFLWFTSRKFIIFPHAWKNRPALSYNQILLNTRISVHSHNCLKQSVNGQSKIMFEGRQLHNTGQFSIKIGDHSVEF